MLDWLRRPAAAPDTVRVGARELPLVIRRVPNARRMVLRLAPDGSEVRISMPRWGQSAEALAFARSRAAWLTAQLARMPDQQRIAPGALLPYRGELHRIAHDPANPRRPNPAQGLITIGGPAESIEPRLRRWLLAEARAAFTADIADYAPRAGVPVPTIALSGARSRWGSCSASKVLRLNWRLVMAPDFVRRSVVAHEVAHLLHFDHSPRFHTALRRIYEGDIALANQWLKGEGRGLYAWFG